MPEGIGIGLAMPFALEILKVFPDEEIGFIPAARGGSNLDQWMPGNENFERAMCLYERAVRENNDVRIAGLLWHQGEADSAQATTAGVGFGDALKRFVEGNAPSHDSPGQRLGNPTRKPPKS